MGEYGNNVICYDTESFLIQHWVQVGSIVRSFKFANQNHDLLVVTKDCRVRFYSMLRYEGKDVPVEGIEGLVCSQRRLWA